MPEDRAHPEFARLVCSSYGRISRGRAHRKASRFTLRHGEQEADDYVGGRLDERHQWR
jgi:hypothetical protein